MQLYDGIRDGGTAVYSGILVCHLMLITSILMTGNDNKNQKCQADFGSKEGRKHCLAMRKMRKLKMAK